MTKKIAIVGGGMTGMYVLHHLLKRAKEDVEITVFEKAAVIGPGMPYNDAWVSEENLANSGSREIPLLSEPFFDWLKAKAQDEGFAREHHIDPSRLQQDDIHPRLILGEYFADQFERMREEAERHNADARHNKIKIIPRPLTEVTDIEDDAAGNCVKITTAQDKNVMEFDAVFIATGHSWGKGKEGEVEGYYHTPWPMAKLKRQYNHTVGLLGTSLSAVDVAVTLAEQHGHFEQHDGHLAYIPNPGTENFRMVMHSRQGFFPDLRCNFAFPDHNRYRHISARQLEMHRDRNNGRVSLDCLFDVYKNALERALHKGNRGISIEFVQSLKPLSMEQFVEQMCAKRAEKPVFEWLRDEHQAAVRSLQTETPMLWKEFLDDIAYTASHCIKHMSPKDITRFKDDFWPFVSYVQAFMPLESSAKLLALHDAGKLDAVAGACALEPHCGGRGADLRYTDESGAEHKVHYDTFIRATGQQLRRFEEYPFRTLVEQHVVRPAEAPFESFLEEQQELDRRYRRGGRVDDIRRKDDGSYYLDVGGIEVDDAYRVGKGEGSARIRDLSLDRIMGRHHYCQALPFCNDAAEAVVKDWASGQDNPAEHATVTQLKGGDAAALHL